MMRLHTLDGSHEQWCSVSFQDARAQYHNPAHGSSLFILRAGGVVDNSNQNFLSLSESIWPAKECKTGVFKK